MTGPNDKTSTEKLAKFAAIVGGVLFLILLIFGKGFFGALFWGVIVAAAVFLIVLFGFDGKIPGMSDTSGAEPTGPAARASAPPQQAPPPARPSPESAGDIGGEPTAPAPEPEAPARAPEPPVSHADNDGLAARKGSPGVAHESEPPVDDGTEEEPADVPERGPTPGTRPTFLHAARADGPDNLKSIKGVGPKLEELLNEMGVYHFDQIAAWGPDEVAWMDGNLKGFKGRVSRDEWVAQAGILAAGGETEFSKKSGRK